MLEIISLPRGSYEILGFFVVFRVLHSLLTNYGPIPSSLSTANARSIWMYRNITVSFVHSFFSAFLSLYWWVSILHLVVRYYLITQLTIDSWTDLDSFFDEPAMLTDMFTAWSDTAFVLVVMSTGMCFDHLAVNIIVTTWFRFEYYDYFS